MPVHCMISKYIIFTTIIYIPLPSALLRLFPCTYAMLHERKLFSLNDLAFMVLS